MFHVSSPNNTFKVYKLNHMVRTHTEVKQTKHNSSCLLNVNLERQTSGLGRHLAAYRFFQVKLHSGTRNETLLKRQHLTCEPNLALRQDVDEAVPTDEHKQIIKLRAQWVRLSMVKLQGIWKNHFYCSLNVNSSQTKSIVFRNIFKVKDETECFLPKVLKYGIAQACKFVLNERKNMLQIILFFQVRS